jgi:predicted transcriptional regulator
VRAAAFDQTGDPDRPFACYDCKGSRSAVTDPDPAQRSIEPDPELERALGLLGPLEARIMSAVWSGDLPQPFVVRSVQPLAPELAYTTLMTTLNRLADKGLLAVEHERGRRAYAYRAAGRPRDYLVLASREQAQRMRERFGDAALTAFAAELGDLTAAEVERLREMAEP